MIGREAYQNPSVLFDVDRRFYGDDTKSRTRHQVVEAMLPYIEQHLTEENATIGHVTRHMLGLFQQMRGAKQWRRYLSENAHRKGAGTEVIREALALVPEQDDEALSA